MLSLVDNPVGCNQDKSYRCTTQSGEAEPSAMRIGEMDGKYFFKI